MDLSLSICVFQSLISLPSATQSCQLKLFRVTPFLCLRTPLPDPQTAPTAGDLGSAKQSHGGGERADGSIGGTAAPTTEGAVEMPVFETPFDDIIVGDGGRSVHVPQSSCHGGDEVMSRPVLLTRGSHTWSMHLHGASARARVGVKAQGGANPEPSIFTDRGMTPSDGIVDFKFDFESRTFSWTGRAAGAPLFVGSSRVPGNQLGIPENQLTLVVRVDHGATIVCVPGAGTAGTGITSDTPDTIIVSGGSGGEGNQLNGRFKRLGRLRDGYPCYTHESGNGCLWYDVASNFWKLCKVYTVLPIVRVPSLLPSELPLPVVAA